MSGISGLLDIGSGALMAAQAEIDTTSHNIANANTDGYTKQRVVTEAAVPFQTTYGFLGSGVEINRIERVRNAFVDEQAMGVNSDLNKATIQQQTMSDVENIFNETSGGGLSDQIRSLFAAFQTLSQNPEDIGIRQTVMQSGQQVATTFNILNSKLQNERYQVGQEINADVGKINELASTIAGINSQVVGNAAAYTDAPDLKDQMDNAISQLSNLINVKVTVDPTGVTNVTAGGAVLVAAGTAYSFKMNQTADNITISRADSTQPATVVSGEISGLLDTYNSQISSFSSKLDDIANTLVKTVNSFNSTGYTLATNGNPAQTGKTFFQGNSAGSIQISPDISSNLNNIAASSSGDPGNGDNAAAIANVLNAPVMSNGQSIVSAYEGFVGDVGLAAQRANNSVQTLQIAQNQMKSFQTSISGVSLDEELANMIQYQHSFEAAAKVVTTADSMYQTIIGMVA